MKTTDVDYTDRAVDRAGRKSNLSMFMVMLGFGAAFFVFSHLKV